MKAPAKVGKFEGKAPVMPVCPEPVIVGAAPVKEIETPPVICAVLVCTLVPVLASFVDSVFCAVVFEAVFDSDFDSVAVASDFDWDSTREEMLGMPPSEVVSAAIAIARSPAPAMRSGMRVENFML